MQELIAGPYHPPKLRVGSRVHDEMLGEVKVVGRQTGPIPWPLCDEPPRPGPNPAGQIPILCGELVRALCEESIDAVSQYWAVSPRLVRRWRAAIAGTKKGVATALALKKHSPAFRRRFYEGASGV